MGQKFDYTTSARRFALKHPVLNHVAIQVNFWVFAFFLLVIIMHLNTQTLISSYSLKLPTSFVPSFLSAVIGGIVYGVSIGFIDLWIERGRIKEKSIGVIILFRIFTHLIILICLTSFTRYVLWEKIIFPHFFFEDKLLTEHITWKYFFYIILIYTLMMSAIINFINQMNKKFGPGVLLPMFLGKYRNPREEERIFMFLDLQSSTTHAEKLGHLKYSTLIRDSFMDINKVLANHYAEIYQYVGDEMVVSWQTKDKHSKAACIEFFFAVQDQFKLREEHYMNTYGFVPLFKAGMHLGIVTAVEVGEIKRDIAYHGDTLNTAARIQSVCNQYDKTLLVSKSIMELVTTENRYDFELIGDIDLRGKSKQVDIYSVERKHK